MTLFLTMSGCFVFFIHPFLSQNRPLKGEVLVVEGWVGDYCLEYVASLLKTGDYKYIITTGGPLETGSFLKEYKSYAELACSTLSALGVSDSLIFAVPSVYSQKDRTYQAALSLREWMKGSSKEIKSFDLCSSGTHTRRSGYLYRKAFGKDVKIGTIAIKDKGYNPIFWFLYSNGVRSVIDESIAYLYARFCFFAQ
ncbi:MAG: ElyC/SanA/YdcF family protein [Fibrobacter sp.]|nr:ElyC/SanA/YdcF family protein [Fibrobacter sp.]